MLTKLWGKRHDRAEPVGRVPPGQRVYAIGDVHGRADLLLQLEDMIRADMAESPVREPMIVMVGDYVDRGYQSREVVAHLLAPWPDMRRICLKGNHEAWLLTFLEPGPDDTPESLADMGRLWLVHGGRETMMSYGVTPPAGGGLAAGDFEAALVALRAAVPAAHKSFLRKLDLAFELGDYLFVHAGIRPGTALDRQSAQDLLWIRNDFLDSTADHGRIVIHGHTPTDGPAIRANRIGIDTGAFASGRLTCLVLEDGTRRFLTT